MADSTDPNFETATDSGAIHADRPPVRAYPANVTFANLIAENRRKSATLVVGMIILLMMVGAAIAALVTASGRSDVLLPSLVSGAVVAGIVGALLSAWSWYGGASAILAMAGASELEKRDDPQLFNVVEELSIAAGLPMPKVYLIPDPSLNAFATGRDPAHAAVAITSGLRERLTRDELAGVMAHEISHIRHYDIRLAMLMATLAGVIVFASDAARRIAFHSGGRSSRSSDNKGGNPLAIIIIVLALVLIVLAPIVATFIRLAISRQREYLADAGAVELTRYPQGMIGALEKLGACRQPLRVVNQALAPLFIVNPVKAAVERGGHEASSIFLTHPPLHERIARLQALL
ncbi:MAG: M48 family metallopeptidase [Phycisphaerae bacterium]|jgi:heat shock protein HtpX|nr:M48 family metallopeptidase [Phycisphaerae bacterium]